MNYRTASRQQLLAERVRLLNAYRKAQQRSGSRTATDGLASNAAGRGRGSNRVPPQEIDQLAAQLKEVEAEIQRRDTQAAAAAGAAPVAASVGEAPPDDTEAGSP